MHNRLQEAPNNIRLLILCPEPELRKDLEEFFRSDDHFPNIHLVDAVDTLAEGRMTVRRLCPDVVLLVDIGQTDAWTNESLQFSKELNLDFRDISTLLLTTASKATPNYLRGAMNARVFDVIQAGHTSSGKIAPILREVELLVVKAYQETPKWPSIPENSLKRTQTISLFSGRGGVGVSTIATALAGEIARREPNHKVVIVDFDVQFGAVAPILGIPNPVRNLAQLLKQGDINSTLQIQDYFPTVSVGPASLLSVAAPPQSTAELRYLSANQADAILSSLRRSFDYVIIDLPTEINDVTTSALRASDLLLLVCTPELLSVRTTRQVLDVLDLGRIQLRSTTKAQIVLNKVGDEHSVEPKRVEQYFPEQVVARFPSDPVFVNEHILSGIPIGAWQPTKKVGRAFLNELATLYKSFSVDKTATTNSKSHSKPAGLLDKFTRNSKKRAVRG